MDRVPPNNNESVSPILSGPSTRRKFTTAFAYQTSESKPYTAKELFNFAYEELKNFQTKIHKIENVEESRNEDKIAELQYHLINTLELLEKIRQQPDGKEIYSNIFVFQINHQQDQRLPEMVIRDFYSHYFQSIPKDTSPDLPYHLLVNLAETLDVLYNFRSKKILDNKIDFAKHADFDFYKTWHVGQKSDLRQLVRDFAHQLEKIKDYSGLESDNQEDSERYYRENHPALLIYMARAGELLFQMVSQDKRFLIDHKLKVNGKLFHNNNFDTFMHVRNGVFHFGAFDPKNIRAIKDQVNTLFPTPSQPRPAPK